MEIRETIMNHLTKLFVDIEKIVNLFPDSLWQREGIDDMMMVPAFLAHHTIWCMSLGHLLNIPKEKIPNEPYIPRHEKWQWIPDYQREYLPTMSQLLALLNDIREYTDSVYGKMNNDTYIGDNSSILNKVVYTIAHTRHHLGQLTQILKENDIMPTNMV